MRDDIIASVRGKRGWQRRELTIYLCNKAMPFLALRNPYTPPSFSLTVADGFWHSHAMLRGKWLSLCVHNTRDHLEWLLRGYGWGRMMMGDQLGAQLSTALWPWQCPLRGSGIIFPMGPQLFCSDLPMGPMQPTGWAGEIGCSKLGLAPFSCLMSGSECPPAEEGQTEA